MLLLKQRLALPLPGLSGGVRPLASRAECLAAWQQCSYRRQTQRNQRRQWSAQPASAATAAAETAPVVPSPAATSPPRAAAPAHVQTFDYTAMAAATAEMQAWVPAKVEAVVQQETGAALRLRTMADSGEAGAAPARTACLPICSPALLHGQHVPRYRCSCVSTNAVF